MIANRYPQSFYQKLARHLMLTLAIPQGDALVMVFGNGKERTNLEAIANWIASLEDEINLDEAAQRVEALARNARARIEEVMP